jgi:3-hydroxyacyl-CoA dehydrogenase
MTEFASYAVQGEIAVISMNKPPINGLGAALREGIGAGLTQAFNDPKVKGIVLIGTPRAFSGGADITEFGTPKATHEPTLRTVVETIEAGSKPVIAAISGFCLGGGLELALGCHFRIALPDATLGLPEVKLGILPGGGGTQRLPRLLGFAKAVDMIVAGTHMPASKFKDTLLIDQIVEGDLLQAALAFAHMVVAKNEPLKRVRDLTVPDIPTDEALAEKRKAVVAAAKRFPAPVSCFDAVCASFKSNSFDAGLAEERRLITELFKSPESHALRYTFAAERAAAKIPGLPDDTPLRSIKKVGVIGAGTMGGGITMNFISAGLPVVLLETKQEALDKGLATIRKNYETSMKKGKLTQAQLDACMDLIQPTLSYQDLSDVDLVIEAVFENMEVKEQVFKTLDGVIKQGAILASNTSALNIDEIAQFTKRPQDVIGLHFFSPANVMRLLEVVRGAKTAPDVLATCMHMARKIKKIAVVSGVCDGFIGNRMLAQYRAAANELMVQGALPQQIDGAIQAFGFAMGPFRVADLAGLDISWAGRKRRAAANPTPVAPIVDDWICEAGRFGQKTGAGWYRYEAGKRDAIPDPIVEAMITKYRAENGIKPRKIEDSEIIERCMFALVNEAARILEERIAARASDVDIVYLNGYGFPAHVGGPMHYANTVGLPKVLQRLKDFAAEPGANPKWQPAALIVRLVERGTGFN